MTENWQRKTAALRVRAHQKGQVDPGGLRGEIAALRLAIQQVSERAGEVENLAVQLRVLDGLGRASVRLANLLRAQRELEEERAAAALSRALDEMNRTR